jgi:hypothetical protein
MLSGQNHKDLQQPNKRSLWDLGIMKSPLQAFRNHFLNNSKDHHLHFSHPTRDSSPGLLNLSQDHAPTTQKSPSKTTLQKNFKKALSANSEAMSTDSEKATLRQKMSQAPDHTSKSRMLLTQQSRRMQFSNQGLLEVNPQLKKVSFFKCTFSN